MVVTAVPEPVLPMVVVDVILALPDAVALGLPNGRLGPPANDSGPPLEIKPLPMAEPCVWPESVDVVVAEWL
jgi:hypothetical protein